MSFECGHKGPLSKQWHTSKPRGRLLRNSLKLPGSPHGPLTPIHNCTHARRKRTHTHTHEGLTQRGRNEGKPKDRERFSTEGQRLKEWSREGRNGKTSNPSGVKEINK